MAAAQVAKEATPDLIAAWCDYARKPENRKMGPGALVTAIRSGAHPPGARRSAPPAEPCSRHDRLERVWAAIELELRARLGDSPVDIWFAGAHLHATGQAAVIAVTPEHAGWVAKRFGRVLRAICGPATTVVACESQRGGGRP